MSMEDHSQAKYVNLAADWVRNPIDAVNCIDSFFSDMSNRLPKEEWLFFFDENGLRKTSVQFPPEIERSATILRLAYRLSSEREPKLGPGREIVMAALFGVANSDWDVLSPSGKDRSQSIWKILSELRDSLQLDDAIAAKDDMVGYYQLNLSPEEFVRWHTNMLKPGTFKNPSDEFDQPDDKPWLEQKKKFFTDLNAIALKPVSSLPLPIAEYATWLAADAGLPVGVSALTLTDIATQWIEESDPPAQPSATTAANPRWPATDMLQDSDREDFRFKGGRYCTGANADDVYPRTVKRKLEKALHKAATGGYSQERPAIIRKWTLVNEKDTWVYRRKDVEHYHRILKAVDDEKKD